MTTPTAADKERAKTIVHDFMQAWLGSEDLDAKIAQALADERERAAVVAEDHECGAIECKGMATRIAAEIRSQA